MHIELEDAEAQEKITAALPVGIQFFKLRCNAPLELNHCNSLRLTQLRVELLAGGSFTLPNMKSIQVYRNVELDSLTPEYLNSFSILHKLEMMTLVIKPKKMPTTSLLQTFVDILSSLEHLRDLYFEVHPSEDDHFSTGDPVCFKQENFPSLTSLFFKLPCDIVFHPKDVFKSFQLASEVSFIITDRESTLQLSGKSVKVEFIQKVDHLSKLHITEGDHSWLIPQIKYLQGIQDLCFHTNSDWNITGEVSIVPNLLFYEPVLFCSNSLKYLDYKGSINLDLMHRLFDHFNALTELREVHVNAHLSDENCELVSLKLSPHIEKLTLCLNVPVEFSSPIPDSLRHLELNVFNQMTFKLHKLYEFILDARTNPFSLDLPETLKTCSTLKSFSMSFIPTSLPSATFVQDLLHILAKLTHLEKICFGTYYVPELTKVEGSVVINQSDFPSVKSLTWRIPVDVTFYSLDIFDSLYFYGNVIFSSGNIRYEFGIIDSYTITMPNASSHSHLTFMLIYDVRNFIAHETIEFLMQFTNLASVFFEPFSNSDELLVWITSLPSLKKFDGSNMTQEQVIYFLTNFQSTNPTVVIKSYNTDDMSDELHHILKDLKTKNAIADFSSPWICRCENECWLQNKIEENSNAYFECLN